jgi:hypothetical protein
MKFTVSTRNATTKIKRLIKYDVHGAVRNSINETIKDMKIAGEKEIESKLNVRRNNWHKRPKMGFRTRNATKNNKGEGRIFIKGGASNNYWIEDMELGSVKGSKKGRWIPMYKRIGGKPDKTNSPLRPGIGVQTWNKQKGVEAAFRKWGTIRRGGALIPAKGTRQGIKQTTVVDIHGNKKKVLRSNGRVIKKPFPIVWFTKRSGEQRLWIKKDKNSRPQVAFKRKLNPRVKQQTHIIDRQVKTFHKHFTKRYKSNFAASLKK